MVDLFRAIEINDIETVRDIVKKNPSVLNHSEKGKYTPLWKAMTQNNVKIVELLLENGASSNKKYNDQKGSVFSFFHYIAKCSLEDSVSYFKIAEILIKHGANVNAIIDKVKLPDSYAFFDDEDKITTPLRIALEKGNLKYAEFLLKNGARLKGFEWNGKSPVYYAFVEIRLTCIEMLHLLLKYGLNTTFRNKKGENLLHSFINQIEGSGVFGYAAKIAEVLLESGVPLNEMNNSMGCSPLHLACLYENIEMASFLIKKRR